jgi:hypothetical protein
VSTPRKHHYIPVFYLKQWTGADRKLCEFKRVPGKIAVRRTFPDGTGYERDLYRIESLPPSLCQVFESEFMKMVDTDANRALQKIACGDVAPWGEELRSAWTRFILSLRFRNPEAVQIIKRQMLDVWRAGIDQVRANYDKLRRADDPPTFSEFMVHTEPEAPHKAALMLLQEIIDNKRVGPSIFAMHWSRVSLEASRVALLTSDRPLDWPHGLDSRDAYIALPIGPKMLFVAGQDDTWARRIASGDPTKTVKSVNLAVVHQARKFVWAFDDAQFRFVQNRMSRSPDRPIITDEQRQRAIDAAAGRQTL